MDQDRVYPIDKEHTIMALEAGCRVYYVERGSQDVYEFTRDDVKVENYVTGPQIENIPIAI